MATGLQVCREPFIGELVEGRPTTFLKGDTLDPAKSNDAAALKAFAAYFEPLTSLTARTESEDTTVWLVANQSAVATYPDGSDIALKENITRVRADSDAAKLWPALFKPLSTSYYEVEQATAAPGEKRGAA